LLLKWYSTVFKSKRIFELQRDDEIRETIRVAFMEGDVPTPISGLLEMKPLDFYKDGVLNYDFDLKSDEDLEDFIKAKMKEELGLIENPSETKLEEIIHKHLKKKRKVKTIFFRDFIGERAYEGADLLDAVIIDAEILEEPIRINLDNEL
jgi:hypothetical protein